MPYPDRTPNGQALPAGHLTGTRKGYRQGTHRVAAPRETLERVRGLLEPLRITRVANITGLDCIGIPVVSAYRPNARSLVVSQGKGLDLDAARVSAIMESVELYHAERITLPVKFATLNELRFTENVAPIRELPLVSVSKFHENLSLLWIGGVDLLESEPMWVPFELVHANYVQPLPPGSGCFLMTSNGLASGNHPIEAVCHAICEIIERDAATLFAFRSLEEQHAAQVNLDSVDDGGCRSLLDLFARASVSVGVWEITSDIAIPAFMCVIQDSAQYPFRRVFPVEGLGCHPVREVALARALTEAAQARLTLIAGARDDSREHYVGYRAEDVASHARSRLQRRGARSFFEAPTRVHETLEEDLACLLAEVSRAGITHVVAVDLTHAAFGIPVVRVVIPGLEAYRHAPGYVPGRRALPLLEARKATAS